MENNNNTLKLQENTPEKETIFKTLRIKNYKSISNLEIPLARVNVLIGANGCGKSNILEAVALLAAEQQFRVKISDLQQMGVRITKPSLMRNSFFGERSGEKIEVALDDKNINLSSENEEDIFADWVAKNEKEKLEREIEKNIILPDWVAKNEKEKLEREIGKNVIPSEEEPFKEPKNQTTLLNLSEDQKKIILAGLGAFAIGLGVWIAWAASKQKLKNYLIYALNTNTLRGLNNESKMQPLGIYGEGLDILLSTFSAEEKALLEEYYYLVDWLEGVDIDTDDKHKYKGHKLGRGTSRLYFKDKYMRKNNNLFSAENSNEGVLHVLFYLALFISKKTPAFFAIDNIESSLNPRICRELIPILVELAVKTNKQVLITTHNPAILDGLNLHDKAEQALFVVKRSDKGYTKAERILLKPENPNNEKLKLSEMWMRGLLGGLPTNF